MNFLALKYFLEIASELSFSQASKNLHISQPGLSQQIKSLESYLGFMLFNRNTRKVTLTEEGQYLYSQIVNHYNEIEKTVNYMVENKHIPNAKIKIASVPSAASNHVPGILTNMLTEFPEIEFSLHETTSSHAVELIRDQQYHVSFIRTPIHQDSNVDDNLNFMELSQNTLKFVVSNEHSLAIKSHLNLSDAADEYFIHYDIEHAPALHFLLEKACLASGFSPKIICTGSELLTIVNLVSNNLGVALMPSDMINLIDTKKVKILDIENLGDLSSSISIVWEKTNTPSTITSQVIKAIKEYSFIYR